MLSRKASPNAQRIWRYVESDGIRQQTNTSGSAPVTQEQERVICLHVFPPIYLSVSLYACSDGLAMHFLIRLSVSMSFCLLLYDCLAPFFVCLSTFVCVLIGLRVSFGSFWLSERASVRAVCRLERHYVSLSVSLCICLLYRSFDPCVYVSVRMTSSLLLHRSIYPRVSLPFSQRQSIFPSVCCIYGKFVLQSV